MADAPVVTVGHPTFAGEPLPEAVLLTCSECGELTDWEPVSARPQLQYRAAVHAQLVHDGVVARTGWV